MCQFETVTGRQNTAIGFRAVHQICNYCIIKSPDMILMQYLYTVRFSKKKSTEFKLVF